ncbi:hypothetical protein VTL71DRAFT_5847 [Oculimacula yallundae]|uniref:NACHT domain-containing protein n=1 Tax=Oculimacula yallundae TaxID=86028 RepID=A0ABR4BYM8_9HELO
MGPVTALGVASGAAGLVSLGLTVTDGLLKYYSAVKDATANIKRMYKLAEKLSTSLPHLDESLLRVKGLKVSDATVLDAQKHIVELRNSIQELQEELNSKPFRIVPRAGGEWVEKVKAKGKILLYPFRESTLAHLRELLEYALDDLDRTIRTLTLDIGSKNLETAKHMSAQVDQVCSLLQTIWTDDEHEKIITWLNPCDVSTIHMRACRSREEGTSEWLLQHEKFKSWRSMPSSSLWLHGIPGCGKTVLCSKAIESLMPAPPSRTTVLHFYFDFMNQLQSTTRAFLASLLEQIARRLNIIPEPLKELYTSNENRVPDTEGLSRCLKKIIKTMEEEVYIVVDGLDESSERKEILSLTSAILSWKLPQVRILIASRDEADIRICIEQSPAVELSIKEGLLIEDIRTNIDRELERGSLVKLPNELKAKIKNVLTTKAHGMFRWVACQLDSLRKCYNPKQIYQALNSLPKDLSETYDRILVGINQLYWDDTLRVLKWLAFSEREMTIGEVAEILTIDLEKDIPCYDPDLRSFDLGVLKNICSSLIVITELGGKNGTAQISLAHLTVKEYLMLSHLKMCTVEPMSRFYVTAIDCHTMIALCCMAYLIEISSQARLSRSRTLCGPLQDYSQAFIASHITQSGEPPEIIKMGINFVRTLADSAALRASTDGKAVYVI